MKRLFPRKKDYISSRLRAIDQRLAKIRREIRNLDRPSPAHPARKRNLPELLPRRFEPSSLPDSQKRFVSYLSTGSFQTISLRRHEQKTAKVKMIIATLAIIIIAFLVVYFFVKSMSI